MEKLCAKMLHAAFYKISQRLSKNSKAIDCDCLGKIKTKCVNRSSFYSQSFRKRFLARKSHNFASRFKDILSEWMNIALLLKKFDPTFCISSMCACAAMFQSYYCLLGNAFDKKQLNCAKN